MKLKAIFLLSSLLTVQVFADESHYEDALKSFNEQDFDTAYIHLKNALKENNNHLPAKILYAKLLLRNRYYSEAIEEYQKAFQAGADINLIIEDWATALLLDKQYQEVIALGLGKPLNRESQFDWLMLQALAFEHIGQFETAKQSYQKALQLQPNNSRVLNSIAWNEIKQGNYESAAALVEQALLANSADVKSWHLKGKLYEIQGKTEDALKTYQTAHNLLPQDTVIMRSLAGVYVKLDELTKAQELVDKILEQDDTDAEALLLRSWILAEQNNNDEAAKVQKELLEKMSLIPEEELKQRVSLLFIRGLTAFAQGNVEQARNDLESYVEQTPGDLKAIDLLADIYLKLGQQDAAMSLFQRNETYLFESLPLSLKLSQMYLQQGQYYRADLFLSELRERYPDNEQVILLSAQTLIARGKQDSAVKMIEQSGLGNGQQTSKGLQLSQALLFLQSGAYDKSLEIANQLLAENENQIDYLLLKGASLLKLNQLAEAEAVLNEVISQQDKHFSARFNLAQLHKIRGDYTKAQQLLANLTVERPDHKQVSFMLAEVEFRLGNLQLAEDMLAKLAVLDRQNKAVAEIYSQVLLAQGKAEDALVQINRLNKLDTLNPEYLWQRALIYIELAQIPDAMNDMDVLFGIWAEDAQKLYNLSQLQVRVNALPKAQRSLQKAISLQPEAAILHFEMVKLLIQQNKLALADAKLNVLTEKYENNANLALLKGDLADKLNQPDVAYQYYYQALELDSNFVAAAAKLYQLSKQGIETQKTTQVLQRISQRNPDNVFHQNLLADHYLNIGNNQQAKEQYLALLQNDNFKANHIVLNNLANLYLPENPAAAQGYIEQAMRLKTNSAAVLDTQGWIFYLQNNYRKALELFRQAYVINSSDPTIRYHLAATLDKLGRRQEAIQELNSALSLSEDFVQVQQARTLLEQLSQNEI
ncbi:XrtA/PEP-CTERM system TPR-repeat protein PrsT [Catenovulum sediminis]|uniref:XrtA/PEP-CTERM system TPR-repeat protein PrsT n=1 Tax=Catenovulum sediminis TaxID=1740262 RepID=A0ABV1RMC4_9ALTE